MVCATFLIGFNNPRFVIYLQILDNALGMQSNDCETSENRCDNRLRRPCDHQGSPGSAESVRPSGLSKRLSEIPVAPPGNQNLPRAPLESVGKSNTF